MQAPATAELSPVRALRRISSRLVLVSTVVVLLASLALLRGWRASDPDARAHATELAREALEIVDERNSISYPAALVLFDRALELEPACARAMAGRAVVFALSNNAERAEAEAAKALESDPANGLAYSVQGFVRDPGVAHSYLEDVWVFLQRNPDMSTWSPSNGPTISWPPNPKDDVKSLAGPSAAPINVLCGVTWFGPWDPKKFYEMMKRNPEIKRDEYEFVKHQATLVKDLGMSADRRGQVSYKGTSAARVGIQGITENIPAISNVNVDEGRGIAAEEVRRHAMVAFIGNDLRNRFFEASIPLARRSKLKEIRIKSPVWQKRRAAFSVNLRTISS